MGRITSVKAYANNEVAYIAWAIDEAIAGCLGFEVTRVYLDDNDQPIGERRKCAAWVPFKGQKNPHWLPQDTGVWPVQKLSWRDLTLRKKRDGMKLRPSDVRVRYEVRPVGDADGRTPIAPNGQDQQSIVVRDDKGKPILGADGKRQYKSVRAFEGKARPLTYLGPAVVSNPILVTSERGPFHSTFTNGILAAQWLANVLKDDGEVGKNELYDKIVNPNDPHRKYLAGDTIELIKSFFQRKGSFLVGLYELEDAELEDILLTNADRSRIILSNTGLESGKWDGRNKPARKRLIDAGADIQHRMFNNSTHIGHNKFVVHLSPQGVPNAVLTGSTNWTSTGIAGQTNNALVIEDAKVARFFADYWQRMYDDKQKLAKPFSKPMNDNQQGAVFRASNGEAFETTLSNDAKLRIWFSPNMPQRRKPTSKTKPAPTPPDLEDVYRRMRQAKKAILFLAFYPGQSGRDCVVGEAIEIGEKDSDLIVTGAVSSAQAMPNYVDDKKEGGEVVEEGESPATYANEAGNVTIVRASRIEDRDLLGEFGQEQLTARGAIGAIIHDKLIVIDPLSDDCCVILGSHNLGYKASYSNDENMVIVSGDRALAEAYAVHILDVYDHYRFRAIESQLRRKGKSGKDVKLEIVESWQNSYVSGDKGALSDYFAVDR